MTTRITPRPQHGDVVIERDDWPTVLVVVRHRTGASDPAGEALALARRIARLEELERVAEAARVLRRRYNAMRSFGGALTGLFYELDMLDAEEANDG